MEGKPWRVGNTMSGTGRVGNTMFIDLGELCRECLVLGRKGCLILEMVGRGGVDRSGDILAQIRQFLD